jgi:hypothetical protein
MRKNVWKQKALNQATKALFLAKYVLKAQEGQNAIDSTASEASAAEQA